MSIGLFCFITSISCICPGTLLDGKPIVNLPPKTIDLNKVDFSVEERAFYTKLESDSRIKFKVSSSNWFTLMPKTFCNYTFLFLLSATSINGLYAPT